MYNGTRVKDVVNSPRIVEEPGGSCPFATADSLIWMALRQVSLPFQSVTLQRSIHQLQFYVFWNLLPFCLLLQKNADLWLFDEMAVFVIVLFPMLRGFSYSGVLVQSRLFRRFDWEFVLLLINIVWILQHWDPNDLQLVRFAVKIEWTVAYRSLRLVASILMLPRSGNEHVFVEIVQGTVFLLSIGALKAIVTPLPIHLWCSSLVHLRKFISAIEATSPTFLFKWIVGYTWGLH